MPKAAIRVDASPSLGMGRLRRCQTLAHALMAHGFEITLVMNQPDPTLSHSVGNLSIRPISASHSAEDAKATRQALSGSAPWDWLIVDRYDWQRDMESALRPVARYLMVIDDLANRPHDADCLLDQNFYPAPEERYTGKLPGGCLQLLGPEYALLAPDFARTREACPRVAQTTVSQILVAFGGGEVSRLTQMTLEALAQQPDRPWEVRVIPGATPLSPEVLEAFKEKLRLIQHFKPHNIPELMAQADIAIGAGGTMTWERACLGLPSLVVTLADNQIETTQALAKAGTLLYGGDTRHLTVETLSRHIQTLLNHTPLRQQLMTRSLALVDGHGADRVAAAMLSKQA